MKRIVNSGILLKSLANVASLLGQTGAHSLKALVDLGVQYDKMEQEKESKIIKFEVTTSGGNSFKVQCIPVEGADGVFNMVFDGKGGSKTTESVKQDKFDEAITKYIKDVYHEDLTHGHDDNKDGKIDPEDQTDEQKANAANMIRVKLRPIKGKKAVKLEAVFANYDPYTANEDLCAVCTNPEFCEALPADQSTCWDIVTTPGGELVVDACEDKSPEVGTTYVDIVTAAYQAYFDLKVVHWNTWGAEFDTIHRWTDDWSSQLLSHIDAIAEIGLQSGWAIPDPRAQICRDGAVQITKSAGLQDSVAICKTAINKFVGALELYYANVPHDVQSKFDEFISYWNLENKFKLDRLIGATC